MMIAKAEIEQALMLPGFGSSDFDLNPDFADPDMAQRDAGVLIPLVVTDHGAELVLTKRAAHLKSHPGQISFPGGKRERCDSNIAETALREAWEEIGLPPKSVECLGQLPPHATVTGFSVTATIGWIDEAWNGEIDQNEVAEVFTVPFDFVMRVENYQIQGRHWQGHLRRYYVVPYGPYYIWGATARMLYGLAKRLNP